MNTFSSVLAACLALAFAGCLAGLLVPVSWRARVVGVLTGLSGTAGAALGVSAVTGTTWQAHLPGVLPLAGISLATDPLSGWFLLLVGAVTAATGIYTMGYAGRSGHGPSSRTALAVLPLFTASMLLVPLAASVATFLLAWELMALASLILVMNEHRHHQAVRSAAIWYAAMTQAGFVTILIGLAWAAAASGTQAFAGIRDAAAGLRPLAAGGIFILCLLGFASKAGAVPLHPWLPRAHAEAPSHVSALMSAAMVKLGVYGILRLGMDLLGAGSRWWWLTVAALCALSALYGIVQAVVATDLKRLLAFSTSENVGLILLGVGFAGRISGDTAVGHSLAYSLAVEDALGITVPEQTQQTRAMLLELERLHNHVADIGALCNDVAYGIAHAHTQRIRETLLRLNKTVTGHRLLRGAIIPGGSRLRELPDPQQIKTIAADLAELVDIALGDSVVRERFTGTAILTRQQAIDIGVLEYIAKASGLNYDARIARPFTEPGPHLTPLRDDTDTTNRPTPRHSGTRSAGRSRHSKEWKPCPTTRMSPPP